MMRHWMAVAAASLALAATPALAAKNTVALISAPVSTGASDNGPVVTDALRVTLERHGFKVVNERVVADAIKTAQFDLKRPLTVKDLVQIRQATGVEYVVYPRVMSVGQGVNSHAFQATILVNVGGKSTEGFVATRQVGRTFRTKADVRPETAVIDKRTAEDAAEALLETFFSKVK